MQRFSATLKRIAFKLENLENYAEESGDPAAIALIESYVMEMADALETVTEGAIKKLAAKMTAEHGVDILAFISEN